MSQSKKELRAKKKELLEEQRKLRRELRWVTREELASREPEADRIENEINMITGQTSETSQPAQPMDVSAEASSLPMDADPTTELTPRREGKERGKGAAISAGNALFHPISRSSGQK